MSGKKEKEKEKERHAHTKRRYTAKRKPKMHSLLCVVREETLTCVEYTQRLGMRERETVDEYQEGRKKRGGQVGGSGRREKDKGGRPAHIYTSLSLPREQGETHEREP